MPERKSAKPPATTLARTVPVKQIRTSVTRRKVRAVQSPIRRSRKGAPREDEKENSQQDIRQYFPVRSKRKTASELKKIARESILEAVREKREEGMEIFHCEEKGFGVKAARPFKRGEFICEYSGELMSHRQGKEREELYNRHPERYGSYMYFFQFQDSSYCLDCTNDNGRLGRLLNHSKKSPNVQTCAIGVDGRPCLIFKALKDIQPGEELCYDYGDRTRRHIDIFPWLAQ